MAQVFCTCTFFTIAFVFYAHPFSFHAQVKKTCAIRGKNTCAIRARFSYQFHQTYVATDSTSRKTFLTAFPKFIPIEILVISLTISR